MAMDIIVPAIVTLACILGVPEILHTCPDIGTPAGLDAGDCVWGDWSAWSSTCAMTCKGHGITRSRSVRTPAEGSGEPCQDEDAKDTRICGRNDQTDDNNNCRTNVRITDAQTGQNVHGATVTAGNDQCGQSGSDGVVRLGNTRVGSNIALQVNKQGYDRRDDNLTISDSCPPSTNVPLNPTSTDSRIVMSWRSDNLRDLDIHMSHRSCHVYYGRKVCGQNSLDLDNTIGGNAGGPETITVKQYSSASKYAVFVHQFNSFPTYSMCDSGAKVRIYAGNGQTALQFHVPSNCNNKRFWLVGCFDSSGLGGFVVKNQIMSSPPTYNDC